MAISAFLAAAFRWNADVGYLSAMVIAACYMNDLMQQRCVDVDLRRAYGVVGGIIGGATATATFAFCWRLIDPSANLFSRSERR